MSNKIVPPEWADWNDDMLVNFGDMKYYYENYTHQTMTQAEGNKVSIGDLDGRVSTLEHSIPVGPGGKGAYLDMGGTPDRYPTMTEMVEGDDGKETSFMVVARNDGIYFYNPKTKLLIPPKKGGGTLSIHGQFPQIFEREHAHRHEGRANISGIYTAKTADVGLDSMFLAYEVCTLLVVVNNEGEEYQTAFSPEGTASRIFRNGINTSVWSLHSGGDGGGGSVDPAVIQEINRRLGELEALPVGVDEFHNLSDVNIDLATDTEGLVYIDEFGKVRSDKVNPMLLHGGVPISIKSIGAKLNHAINSSVSGSAFANSPYIILDSTTTRVHTMCRFVAYDASNATVTQGREGRVTYIFNYGSVDQTLRLGTSQRFFTSNGFESGTRTVPAKMSHAYCPVILDNSGVMTECWAFMGAAPLEGIDLSGIEGAILNLNTKVDDHKTRLEALEAGGSVDLTPILDRLGILENAPKPSFFDLTNTPTAGDPGKLIGYNLAGDALTSYDRVVSVTDLVDIPNSMSGQATKLLTVKTDESGFEFTDFPRLPTADPIRDDLKSGQAAVNVRAVTGGSHFGSTQSNPVNMVDNDIITLTGNTARFALLPEIVAGNHPAALTDGQVRVGKQLTFWASGTADFTLKVHSGQKFLVDNVTDAIDRPIKSGSMETYKAIQQGSEFKWIRLSRCLSNNSPLGKDMSYKVDLLSTGNSQASMSAHSDVVVHNLGVNSNPRVWLPVIKAAGTAVGQDDVPLGRKLVVVNTGAQATTISGGVLHFNDSTMVSGYALPVGHSIELFTHDYNGNLGWRVVRSGPISPDPIVDLGPLITRLDALDVTVAGHEIRINALENAPGGGGGSGGGSSTFVGLTDTPSTLTPKKILTVNSAGTSIEMSAATTDDLSGALTLAAGVVSGNSLLSGNCLGAEVVQDGRGTLPSSLIVNGPVLLASVWNDVNTLNLPNIAKFDTQPLTANCVREGRITSVYNCTGNSKTIVIQIDPAVSGVKFQNTTGAVISNFTLGAGKGIRLMPVFDHLAAAANQRFWMVLEVFNRLG